MEKIKVLHYYKSIGIKELEWNKPDIMDDEIEVETIYCGICRSDIGNYMEFESMPYSNKDNPDGIVGTWGHEGLGRVTKIGKVSKHKFSVGDIVATTSDPAYGYKYNCNMKQATVVPEVHKKYIIQPTACAVNIFEKTVYHANILKKPIKNILLVGSGFMSLVIAQLNKNKLTVVGKSLKSFWDELKIDMITDIHTIPDNSYDIVIDLSSKGTNFDEITRITNLEGLICYASTPYDPVTTNFFNNCWKCHTIIMPSPRNSDFEDILKRTVEYIQSGRIDVSDYWTAEYDRNDLESVNRGFQDGMIRSDNYIRGYLKF